MRRSAHDGRARQLMVLAGDGIGPEVVGAALEVLDVLRERLPWPVEVHQAPLGRAALRAYGETAPAHVLREARRADAVLVGAVDTVGAVADGASGPSAILVLRRALGCHAALRPVRGWPGVAHASPIRARASTQLDLLFVRDLRGGAFAGPHRRTSLAVGGRAATDRMAYTESQVRRVAQAAFACAGQRRGQLTSVEYGPGLATGALWTAVLGEVAVQHPQVGFQRMRIGDFWRLLLRRPQDFDVVVTENLLGDILSDAAAALAGSLGLMPSASLGPPDRPALYEPVHGAAPQLAGQGSANPLGAILSLAMLLADWGRDEAAAAIEVAVAAALRAGVATPDIGGSATTASMTASVLERL